MIHRLKLKEVREIIRNLIIEAEDDDDRRGPIDKIKGWQPPANMVRGSDTTDWSSWDRDDPAGDAFIVDDTGDLDEADEVEESEE